MVDINEKSKNANKAYQDIDNDKILNSKLKALSPLDIMVLDTYLRENGDIHNTAKITGKEPKAIQNITLKIQSKQYLALNKNKVKHAFTKSKEARLEFLWKVAENGASLIYDKEGNEIMMSPAVSVAAVRAMNDMIEGSYAPKEITHKHTTETRSEQEIRDNIKKLNAEYAQLAVIEGVTEKQIQQTQALEGDA